MTAPLAALATALSFAAIYEWVEGRSAHRSDRSRLEMLVRRLARPLARLEARAAPLGSELRAAGLERVHTGLVLGIKVALAVAILPIAISLAPAAPGRAAILVVPLACLGAFLAPNLLLRRLARRRREGLTSELPAVLDLMATAAEAGRGIPGLLEIGIKGSAGPLRQELARLVAAIDCGDSQEAALDRLRREGGELAQLAVTMQRSRRLGSPLAVGLRAQASSLREAEQRAIAEHGSKAAPKIQLVVALILVPSVLLMVAAAIAAHSDSIVSGL